MQHTGKILLFILFSLLFSIKVSGQNIWYVDNVFGSDNYNGHSEIFLEPFAGPKKTISSAISSAFSRDTIIILSTGTAYSPNTSEPDTIIISKEIILNSFYGAIDILSNVEINTDVFSDSANGVEINAQMNLLKNLFINSRINLKDTLKLHGNLTLGTANDSSSIGMLTYFHTPLVFNGDEDQKITVPEEGACFGSFEINKPSGNILLEGGDLDLSVEVSDTTIKNVVTFTKGLFITGDNKLVLKAPAGTEELGFIHNPADGDVSHVVGTVSIIPKLGTIPSLGRTEYPVGSIEYYRPFGLVLLDAKNYLLKKKLSASYVAENPRDKVGLPKILDNSIITHYPDFYWKLTPEYWVSFVELIYDMEFTAEGFNYPNDLNKVTIIRKTWNIITQKLTWFLQGYEYDNSFQEGKVIIKCMCTMGAFNDGGNKFTFGLPTNLYTTGVLPDIQMTTSWPDTATIGFYDLFRGNKGELTYRVTVDSDSIVSVPENEFTETTFNIIALDTGLAVVTITANDTNSDFLTTSFEVMVEPVIDGIEDENISLIIPEDYMLLQNYPNPFNPTTTIRFGLPERACVVLKIYNSLGEEVATLLNNEELNPGYHSFNFDAGNISSGIYFCKIDAGNFHEVRKMILLK